MTTASLAPAIRVALIDDHQIVAIGFAGLLREYSDIEVVCVTNSVGALLAAETLPDLVVLDLRLGDGSSAVDNIQKLQGAGFSVLILTAADDSALIRSAAKAGVLGVIRKSQPTQELVDAIRRARQGEAVVSVDWAAAIDADSNLGDAGLTPREQQVLSLYAAGASAQSVAFLTKLSKSTVDNHVSRIRTKYASVGRTAHTKVDLHQRAVEDGLLDGTAAAAPRPGTPS